MAEEKKVSPEAEVAPANPPQFDLQEVELSDDENYEAEKNVGGESPKESEVTQEENEQNLEDYEKALAKAALKTQIAKVLTTDEGAPGEELGEDNADEFVRNFFIKYGMKRTLDSFQKSWFKLKTENKIQANDLMKVPKVYLMNQRLHDELAALQKDLDTAKITMDKAETTGKKLCKQRDLKKIQHRRIQQEKDKLNQEIEKLKEIYEKFQKQFKELSKKYEALRNEKMLLDFQRKGISGRCEQAQKSLKRLEENLNSQKEKEEIDKKLKEETGKKSNAEEKKEIKPAKEPTAIPDEVSNPYIGQRFDPLNIPMKMEKTRKGHMLGVSSVAIAPKKDIFATSSDDSTWKLWTLPQGELIMCGEGHQDWVSSVCFHPRGMMLASASGDSTVKIWDLVTASYKITLTEHSQSVWSVDYHFSGDFLISGSMDQSCKLWDINMQKCKYSYRGHVDSINSVKWKPFSNYFVTGSADKSLSLWDIRSNLCVQTFNGHENAVNSVAFNLMGDLLVSGDADGKVRVWDVKMVKEMACFDCGKYAANCVAIDYSGNTIVVAGDDGIIRFANIQEKKLEEATMSEHEDSVQALAFSNDGKLMISGGADCTYKIWS